jgi:SH3-like domain-containing protein
LPKQEGAKKLGGGMMKIAKMVVSSLVLLCVTCQSFGFKVCVNSHRVNIRKGPGLQHQIIWQVFKNTPLEVITKKGDWYQIVDYAGYDGWIYSDLASRERCVIVKTETAYVYSKPSLYSFIEWEVDKEYPFRVLQIKDEWVKVSGYQNTLGWIPIFDIWGI